MNDEWGLDMIVILSIVVLLLAVNSAAYVTLFLNAWGPRRGDGNEPFRFSLARAMLVLTVFAVLSGALWQTPIVSWTWPLLTGHVVLMLAVCAVLVRSSAGRMARVFSVAVLVMLAGFTAWCGWIIAAFALELPQNVFYSLPDYLQPPYPHETIEEVIWRHGLYALRLDLLTTPCGLVVMGIYRIFVRVRKLADEDLVRIKKKPVVVIDE